MFGSPTSVFALPASVIATACSAGGGVRCFRRPSARSYSGWVCCCVFDSPPSARWFASKLTSTLAIPFCRIRPVSDGFSVSIPCFVRFSRFSSSSLRVGGRRFRCFGVNPSSGVGSSASSASSSRSLSSWFSPASAVGFSGSRSVVPEAAVSLAVSLLPSGVPVSVGCASGVDKFVRSLLSSSGVRFLSFSVSSGAFGVGRGAFAARSIACIRSVSSEGLWVSFPSTPCPSGLFPSSAPSRCFCGLGSGSWASLAFAVGSGIPSLVFLGSLPCPAGWELFPVSGSPGWFGFWPSSSQLSLF